MLLAIACLPLWGNLQRQYVFAITARLPDEAFVDIDRDSLLHNVQADILNLEGSTMIN